MKLAFWTARKHISYLCQRHHRVAALFPHSNIDSSDISPASYGRYTDSHSPGAIGVNVFPYFIPPIVPFSISNHYAKPEQTMKM